MKEIINVEIVDGVMTDRFDVRVSELLCDSDVKQIVGPVIEEVGTNPGGAYRTFRYTIWYERT